MARIYGDSPALRSRLVSLAGKVGGHATFEWLVETGGRLDSTEPGRIVEIGHAVVATGSVQMLEPLVRWWLDARHAAFADRLHDLIVAGAHRERVAYLDERRSLFPSESHSAVERLVAELAGHLERRGAMIALAAETTPSKLAERLAPLHPPSERLFALKRLEGSDSAEAVEHIASGIGSLPTEGLDSFQLNAAAALIRMSRRRPEAAAAVCRLVVSVAHETARSQVATLLVRYAGLELYMAIDAQMKQSSTSELAWLAPHMKTIGARLGR